MTKHTPGPWTVGSQVMGYGFNLWSDSTGGVVAWVEPRHNFEDEETGEMIANPPDMTQHPDARLLASAPDLLVALRNLLDHTCGTDSFCEWCERHAPKDQGGSIVGPIPHVSGCLWLAAERAIAKAEGRG